MELGNHRDTRNTVKAMGLMFLIVGVTLAMTSKDKEVAKVLMDVISVGTLAGAIEAYLDRRASRYMHNRFKPNVFLIIVRNILFAGGLFTMLVVVATVIFLVKYFSLKLALVIVMVAITYTMLVVVAKEIINIVEEYLHKKGIK